MSDERNQTQIIFFFIFMNPDSVLTPSTSRRVSHLMHCCTAEIRCEVIVTSLSKLLPWADWRWIREEINHHLKLHRYLLVSKLSTKWTLQCDGMEAGEDLNLRTAPNRFQLPCNAMKYNTIILIIPTALLWSIDSKGLLVSVFHSGTSNITQVSIQDSSPGVYDPVYLRLFVLFAHGLAVGVGTYSLLGKWTLQSI